MPELKPDPAFVADYMVIVRVRFVEAADTMASVQMRNLSPSIVRTLWPSFPGETVGGHHAGYGQNGDRIRYVPSRLAISRAEEVMTEWLLDPALNEEHRILITRWSAALARPKWAGSFAMVAQRVAERPRPSWIAHGAKPTHRPDFHGEAA